jgi:inosine/xanthosine triphosphatase
MRVAVGSQNPVKVAATEIALDGQFGAEVVPADVDPGVAEQPRGHPETVAGAENRAQEALAGTDAALGVGVEGGVAAFDGTDGRFLVMWAAVTDGERVGRGAGPSMRLPAAVADRVRAGEELGPVMDDLLDKEGVARGRGATGVLTGGAVDREAALADAVAGALGPFVTDLYG